MKKNRVLRFVSSVCILCLIIFAIFSNYCVYAERPHQYKLSAELLLENIQNPYLTFEVWTPDNLRASKVEYIIENLHTNKIVMSGVSENGVISYKLSPSKDDINSKFVDTEYYYVDYAFRVFDLENKRMAHFFFSVPVIKESNKLNYEQLADIEFTSLSNKVIPLQLKPYNDSNVFSLGMEEKDVNIQSIIVIDWSEAICATRVGLLSGMKGMSSTFEYTSSSTVSIEAKINYGSGWSTNGSVNRTISTQSTHSFNSTLTSGDTRWVRENFRYRWEKKGYATTGGPIWEEVRPVSHIGALGWVGTTYPLTYNNGKPKVQVRAGSWGNWYVIRPTNYSDKSIKNGYSISGAASYKGASIGLKTSYETTVKIKLRSNDGRNYLAYDLNGKQQEWYVTLD